MSSEIQLLTEIRDLLQIMAEPALAARDAKLRVALRDIVGGSGKKAAAIRLMDGTRTQSLIAKETGMDGGNLSRMVKSLEDAKLVTSEQKNPLLGLKIPANFFEEADKP